MSDLKRLAARALGLLDLTNLADDCDSAAIAKLCAKAVTPHGNVAAICIWPRFVAEAKQRLAGKGITLATVANFPAGGDDAGAAADEASRAWADGADEVDVVIPYRRLMTGDERSVQELVAAAVARRPPGKRLKTILETGELQTPELIAKAARIAIAAGADFIKTSTGKTKVSATPEVARIMLEAIRDARRPVGFKPSGGIRTLEDAAVYLDLAGEIMGARWVSPATFRFGASGLLDDLLARLGHSAATHEKDSVY